LESALAQPQASFGGQLVHDGLFAMAAAYLFHIVSNHPFVDGNKRTGTTSAIKRRGELRLANCRYAVLRRPARGLGARASETLSPSPSARATRESVSRVTPVVRIEEPIDTVRLVPIDEASGLWAK